MKKIGSLIVIIAIIVLGIVFVPRLVHKCDDCGNVFLGTGYDANIVSDLLEDDEQTICKDCAEEQHALSIMAGKSLDDYKKPLF